MAGLKPTQEHVSVDLKPTASINFATRVNISNYNKYVNHELKLINTINLINK